MSACLCISLDLRVVRVNAEVIVGWVRSVVGIFIKKHRLSLGILITGLRCVPWLRSFEFLDGPARSVKPVGKEHNSS